MPIDQPPSPGIPGAFIALFVIFAVIGVGVAIWKFSVAKESAEEMGVSPSTATKLALIDPDTTAVAGSLGSAAIDRLKDNGGDHTSNPSLSQGDLDQRLADLDEAHKSGRVTEEEYQTIRKRLLDSF